jgi:hypothetical protein
MSARQGARGAWGVLLASVLLGLTGCDPDPAYRLRRAEEENRRLTAAVAAAEQASQGSSTYAAEVANPRQAAGTFSMYYSRSALEQMAAQALPYRMSGKDFHGDVSGEIILERVTNFRMASRNRLVCSFHIRGENVRYTGSVPPGYQKEVDNFQRAVAQGGVAEVEVQLSLHSSTIRAQARAVRVQLNAKKSGAEGRILHALNNYAFKTPIAFEMNIGGTAPRRLLITGNHVVLTYAP